MNKKVLFWVTSIVTGIMILASFPPAFGSFAVDISSNVPTSSNSEIDIDVQYIYKISAARCSPFDPNTLPFAISPFSSS